MLDMGSLKFYINEKYASKKNSDIIPIYEINIEVANGIKCSAKEVVTLDFHIVPKINNHFNFKFY